MAQHQSVEEMIAGTRNLARLSVENPSLSLPQTTQL